MGAHIEISVSREKARMYLIRKAMSMSDSELEDALDRNGMGERLYQTRITCHTYGPDDDLLDYRG